MPRLTLPPTPASSTDIKGKDGTNNLSSLQLAFELPPPALANAGIRSPTDTKPPSRTRRRSSTAAKEKEFALPPPPTRSRKIIQMKPKRQEEDDEDDEEEEAQQPSNSRTGSGSKNATTATTPASTAGAAGKKKQPSATSAAGRKIARKTAHSLIERRRRSKMNEEFAVLKSMIPACTGEMHKLAILQASIEYVRYLEDCVTQLKSQSQSQSQPQTQAQSPTVPQPQRRTSDNPSPRHEPYGNPPATDRRYPPYVEDTSADVEMAGSSVSGAGSGVPSPTYTNHQSSISPALRAQDSRHRQESYSSVSTDHRQSHHYGPHYSQSVSATTSPAFGPQPSYTNSYTRGTVSASGSTLTSPALGPQRDLDQEATAALLMLNNDRRGFSQGGGAFTPANSRGQSNSGTQHSATGRGMSVRDLLST